MSHVSKPQTYALWDTEHSVDTFLKYRQMAEIACFVSDTAHVSQTLYELPVYTPAQMVSLLQNCIVITDIFSHEEARTAMTAAGFPEERIVTAENLFCLRNPIRHAEALFKDCCAQGFASLLDYGCHFSIDNLFTAETEHPVYGCLTDALPAALPPVFGNLYHQVFQSPDDIPTVLRGKAVYLGDLYRYRTLEDGLQLLLCLTDRFRGIYMNLPHPDTPEHRKWHLISEMPQFRTRLISDAELLMYVEAAPKDENIRIFVATHKECRFPDEPSYTPLWLGREEDNIHHYLNDKTVPSISRLNKRINECTGLYWIWQHADRDITGLVHYRRYFVRKEGMQTPLRESEILRVLDRYDCIVPKMRSFALPVGVQLCAGLDPKVCEQAFSCFRRLIAERQPEYADAFEQVMNGHLFFPFNMLIMRKEHFDHYAAWLFSILTDAAETLDFDTLPGSHPRIAGYFAERMLTVWLTRQSLRLKQLPVERIDL
ncbi:MAG: DUF4422 domain-containing protein [Lachnospiraceae bacterium]|nr:DUF4422 domain-containing protein [Lachnospiraceae bacterium]